MLSPEARKMIFVIKAEIGDPGAETFTFTAQKTMYGGKHIAAGDTIFLFASGTKAEPASSQAASSPQPKPSQRKTRSPGKPRA
jgi:hypothetical protein